MSEYTVAKRKKPSLVTGACVQLSPSVQVMTGLGSEINYQMVLFCWNERKVI